MRNLTKRQLHAAIAMGLMVVFSVTLSSCLLFPAPPPPSGDGSPDPGGDAPGVALKDNATGRTVNIPGDLSGKPFALLFFSYG